jgi:hypothetical protein
MNWFWVPLIVVAVWMGIALILAALWAWMRSFERRRHGEDE